MRSSRGSLQELPHPSAGWPPPSSPPLCPPSGHSPHPQSMWSTHNLNLPNSQSYFSKRERSCVAVIASFLAPFLVNLWFFLLCCYITVLSLTDRYYTHTLWQRVETPARRHTHKLTGLVSTLTRLKWENTRPKMMFQLQKRFNWELLQDEPHFGEFLRNNLNYFASTDSSMLGGVRGFRIFTDSNAFFQNRWTHSSADLHCIQRPNENCCQILQNINVPGV